MTVSDQEIISRFPVGYYELHPNVSLNFQLNRFYGWANDGQMLDEIRAAVPRISSYDDWVREMLQLSDNALAAGRLLPAAYYSRGAHFFLDPDDPRYQPALQRFLDNVLAGNGVTPDDHHLVPYQGTHLSAYRFTPARARGTIVVFGGFDSYIVEWLPAAIALRDAGLDTVIFDGPGQGTVLDAGTPMTPDWHLPVAAVLDYFGLSGITLMGFSLGGSLVLHAAAREPRVARVIAFDIMTDMFECVARGPAGAALGVLVDNAAQLPAPAIDAAAEAIATNDLLTQWMLRQARRVMGVESLAELLKVWQTYSTADVAPLVAQPVLLMAGTKDHYVPLHQLGDQVLTLSAASSVSARVFTEAEQAHNHCQIGNTGLAIKVILDWLDTVGGRTTNPDSTS
ncbi:MAG TPA: alpha/beta fold hydrolase [Mycobacterium sp.]|nr:alpha/beta fold hydrolase [Mycobacterium sp.]